MAQKTVAAAKNMRIAAILRPVASFLSPNQAIAASGAPRYTYLSQARRPTTSDRNARARRTTVPASTRPITIQGLSPPRGRPADAGRASPAEDILGEAERHPDARGGKSPVPAVRGLKAVRQEPRLEDDVLRQVAADKGRHEGAEVDPHVKD